MCVSLCSCGESSVQVEEPVDSIEVKSEEDTISAQDLVDLVDRSMAKHIQEKRIIDSLCKVVEEDSRERERYVSEIQAYQQQHNYELTSIVADVDSLIITAKDSIVYNIEYVDSVIHQQIIVYDTIVEDVIIKNKKKRKRNGNN
jgi:hypothetical protein